MENPVLALLSDTTAEATRAGAQAWPLPPLTGDGQHDQGNMAKAVEKYMLAHGDIQ